MNKCYNVRWHNVNWYDPRVTDDAAEDVDELDVDELARRAGTTVRNVRLYQERGLLPKPERRGRKAVYSPAHLTRLQLVLQLMGRGYSLAAIKDLTDAWDRDHDLAEVLGVKDGKRFSEEEPWRLQADELRAIYPATDVPYEQCIERDLELGILVRDGDDFVVPSPEFFAIGKELVESGIPMTAVEDTAEQILAGTRLLADVFMRMFLDEIWGPFVAAGKPEDQVPHVLELVDRLSPLVSRAVVAALGLSMQERVERALVEEMELD